MFPSDGLTKADVADYYRQAAPAMLRHLAGRPVVMQRFPDGIDEYGFFHKDVPDYFPDWVERTSVAKREGGSLQHVVCSNAATLVYLANQGCITLHQWLSRTGALEKPDLLVIDLDPPEGEFVLAVRAAGLTRELLEELGLCPYVKTTGGKGLHVVVPLDAKLDYQQVRGFAAGVAEVLAVHDPDRLTTEFRVAKRRGRLYLDIGRNAYGQHVVAPYSLRPRQGAPVATPLDWEECSESLDPRQFTPAAVLERLEQRGDPWSGMRRHARSLLGPCRRLQELVA